MTRSSRLPESNQVYSLQPFGGNLQGSWRTKGEYASLMEVRICRVSFTTTSGIRHSAEIQADSLYEAAVEGIKAISQQWGEQPGIITPIEIEIKSPSVRHQVTL